MLLDILDEGMAHTHRMLTGTHQQIGIAVYIMYLEKELRLALVILQNGLQPRIRSTAEITEPFLICGYI